MSTPLSHPASCATLISFLSFLLKLAYRILRWPGLRPSTREGIERCVWAKVYQSPGSSTYTVTVGELEARLLSANNVYVQRQRQLFEPHGFRIPTIGRWLVYIYIYIYTHTHTQNMRPSCYYETFQKKMAG